MVDAPESVEPGQSICITLYAPSGATVARGELVDEADRTLVSNRGFVLTMEDRETASLVLLGVPTTVAPGNYQIRVNGFLDDNRPLTLVRSITVVERTFRRQKIRLDKSLSELRAQPDPRKDADARRLWGILTRFDPEAVFDVAPFKIPVSSTRQTSGFGDRREYTYADGATASTIHAGLDLAVPAGTPVAASAGGRVLFAGFWLITGNTVVIEHLPGVYSLYYHMQQLLVAEGDTVERGEEIGKVGSTGLATGPHLHWEVRVGGVAVDPRLLLGTGLVDEEKIRHTIDTYRRTLSEGG